MAGAFNEALLVAVARRERGCGAGCRRPHPRSLWRHRGLWLADQFSNRFVSEEIGGLEAAAVGVPPIFLAVAAFLLYIVISRMVQSEREEIGLMKAFGYTNAEVGAHYFKLVLAIAVRAARWPDA
jgi:putative ABC transport system permease protein